MDRKRLREVRARAKEQFLQFGTQEELDIAASLLEGCDRGGESVYTRLDRRFRRSRQLLDITRALNSERHLDQLLQMIVDAAIDLCGAERGVLILGESEPFNQVVARRFGKEDLVRADLQFSRTIAARVIEENQLVQLEDAMADDELGQKPSVAEKKLRSIMAGPLRGRDRILGVLYVDNRFAQGVFSGESLEVLGTLADQAAVAIENARVHTAQQTQLERMEGIVDNLGQQLLRADGPGYHDILGDSPRMRELFAVIEKIKGSDIPVLIQGESGTGKELAARAVHQASRRAAAPFVSENCAAISEGLLESELFGHVEGAFTGASQTRQGLFELANGGTLFLDEVADMSDSMQKKLLRVLQEGEVRPVGGKQPIPLDVRIISATNQPLGELVAAGRFRQDLFYRLGGITLELPSLRARRGDIPLLVDHFLRQLAAASGEKARSIERDALDVLIAHDWPGNIRELRNEVQAADALCDDGAIRAEHLSAALRAGGQSVAALGPADELRPLDEVMEAVEKAAVVRAIAACKNKTEAAAKLDISRYSLNRKLQKYGLE